MNSTTSRGATGATIASVVLALAAVGLGASGRLVWFSAHIGTAKPPDIGGFRAGRGNAWISGVPVGWIMLGVAVAVLSGAVLLLSAPTQRLRFRGACVTAVLGVGTAVLLFVEQAHVHDQVRADLEAAMAVRAQKQPELADQIQAALKGAHLDNQRGLWAALVAAGVIVLASVWVAAGSRRQRL
ncbi:unannotated protein [freshwater metagenome]|uniref:Unannotated protein n=1 Tax=freshwater metagenome TaxID=449393 RepID=A0A6J7EV77_9ZZZZ|nr:hypothetical protein [Actinomycetota bacterium]